MPPSKSRGKKYADPNTLGARGRTPLHRAARGGRLQALKELIAQGADIHIGDEAGEQALGMAARKGHLECVKYLIEAGAEVNYLPPLGLTPYSETALCSATRKSLNKDCTAIVSVLLKAGADPNIGGDGKRFPIHEAAACGYPAMVNLIIEAGAKLNVMNGSGMLPLHCALESEKDNTDVVQILLGNGADLNAADAEGRTPIFDALWSLQWRERNTLSQFQTILAAKPDLTKIDPEMNMGVLEYANHLRLRKAMQLLRDAGAPEIQKRPDEEDNGAWEINTDENGNEVLVRVGDSDCEENTDENGNELCVKLSDDFDWRNSSDHIKYLSYLQKPKPPYYENWTNISGESGQDAIARFLRVGALTLCDTATRGAFKYSVSELKNMVQKAGHKPKEKKADLIEQAQRVAGSVFEAGILDVELYATTQFGVDAVAAIQGAASENEAG